MFLNSLSTIAGLLYICLGVFVIINKNFGVRLESTPAYILGSLLCSYGIFRIARVIIRLRNKNNED